MNCIVILTIFDTSKEVRDDFIYRMKCLAKEINWDLKRMLYGIHRQASRAHTHITFCYDCGDSKIWKILADKIKRSKAWEGLSWNNGLLKITHKYSDAEGYDEQAAIRYNLKEYENDDQMWGDVSDHNTMLNGNVPYLGVTKVEAETMRRLANEQYEVVKAKRAKDEKDKLNTDNKRLRLWDYIKTRETIDRQENIHYKVQRVVIAILKFNKEEDTSFRINSLKDMAVNFLYKEGYISEIDICEYLHI